MRHGRLLTFALIALVSLVILGGAFVWALPEIIRRVALQQIPKHTGRAAAIDDIDLNPFTGRLAVKKFRLAEREGAETFVAAERLDAKLVPTALLRSEIRLADVALIAPSIRVLRTASGELNFSDLLPRADSPPAEPPPEASGWTVTVDRLRLSNGAARVRDEAVSPPAEWTVQDLGVEVDGVTTRAGAAPGRAAVRARIDEAALDVTADPLRLEPLKAGMKIALDGFEIRRAGPYIYAATPYRPKGGQLALALGATIDHEGDELTKASASGTVTIDHEAIARTEEDDPFLSVSRVAVDVKEADAIRRTLTVASVGIDGLAFQARRDRKGVIDVLDMLTPTAPAARTSDRATPAASPSPPPVERQLLPVLRGLARGFEHIVVERITLAPSTATFVDAFVQPTTKLALTRLRATVTDLTWPPKGPAKLDLSTRLPGGGTLAIKGPVLPQPFDADLAFRLRDAPVTPYQAYIPVPAQLSGRFNGDSRNRIAFRDGTMVLASKGNSWAQDVQIRAPGEERPAIRVERMDLVGIDFDWPRRAAVERAGFRRLAVQVEREADGSFDVRKLFEAPATKAGAYPSASPGPAPAAPREEPSKNLLDTMRLAFKEVRLEQGSVRFLDRTTSPAVSQDLSRLELTARNVTNRPGERAQLALQSVVGGDATLDVRGEVGPIGSPAFVDLIGELDSFQLPSVDPYAEAATGWTIKRGELQYKVRFKLDGDALEADNEVVVGRLQVAPAGGTDEVKKRIGLPLGLIVSLVKDGQGEIRANVPVTGSINDPQFSLRETIWTAVKNVLTNIVKAPFRAIGRHVSRDKGEDEEEKLDAPSVAPVTFAAGSSVIAPEMEEHLLRVADFLRRTPFVNLALSPAPSAADARALKAEAVSARLREFQKERGLTDEAAVVAAYFEAHLPDVPPPATLEEQLALLREREPVPESALDDLARRRVEATRERLASGEGIPAERLTVSEGDADAAPAPSAAPAAGTPPAPSAAPAADGGRVEFTVVARGE
jgi:hypothetical protein